MKRKKEKKKRRICYVQRYGSPVTYTEGGESWQNATIWTAPSQVGPFDPNPSTLTRIRPGGQGRVRVETRYEQTQSEGLVNRVLFHYQKLHIIIFSPWFTCII